MSFVFAYIAIAISWSHDDWPLRLIHLTEVAFIILAFVCIVLAARLQGSSSRAKRDIVAFVGGVSMSFGLIMPLELAPMFFDVRGEWMMATVGLIVVYPIAAVLFVLLFANFMKIGAPPDTRYDLLGATKAYQRGIGSFGTKDHDRAIADFTVAIRCHPKYAFAYFKRGAAYLEKGDYDHAIADYDKVIALNSKLAPAYTNRGNAYRAMGALDRANADFDQADALMREEELRRYPEPKMIRTGLLGVFDVWSNSRGVRP